ncbi:MAG: XdhC family protein [Eubacteriales bacterium]|nr:XdhC family protein [Eubacteriales bacterium]
MTVLETLELAKNMLGDGKDIMLAHIANSDGSTPRSIDAYMLIDKDKKSYGTVGGGSVEYKATLDGAKMLENKSSGHVDYSLTRNEVADIGMICGGNIEVDFTYLSADKDKLLNSLAFIEEIISGLKSEKGIVYMFGGGHVSVATAELLNNIGFDTVVYDDRGDFVNAQRFPHAKRLICSDYEDVLSKVNLSEKDYVLIMTRGHEYDYMVQRQILKTKAGFIGVIGSRRKLATIEAKLLNDDGFTKDDTARFYAPVGLQIGAETPEEIAVSIAAELILKRAVAENRRKVAEKKTLRLEDIRQPF